MTGKDDPKLRELTQKKMELALKLRELRAEIGRVNVELSKAGADAVLIACW